MFAIEQTVPRLLLTFRLTSLQGVTQRGRKTPPLHVLCTGSSSGRNKRRSMHVNRESRQLGPAERGAALHIHPARWLRCATAFATMLGSASTWAAPMTQPLESIEALSQRWVPGPVAYAVLSTMAALLAMIIVVMMVYAQSLIHN